MNKNKFTAAKLLLFIFGILLFPRTGISQIAGYNVISVHGLILSDLVSPPSRDAVLNRRSIGNFWASHSEGFLNWSGADRLEGGIAEIVFEQAKQHSANGLCVAGCVLVTHSTGDLVSRYFMANQEAWLTAEGYEPLNIVATIDLAGAGGGTELADLAVASANSFWVPLPLKWAAGAVLGLDLDVTDYDELGVVIDLRTSAARNTAMWPSDIPRLRFSVDGAELLDPLGPAKVVSEKIIPGKDDTVVPAHSSCGSASPEPIKSCSKYVDYYGKLGSYKGPEGLLHNHFPILMAHKYDHFNMIQDDHRGKSTFVLNNFFAGLNVDFQTYTKTVTRKWWEAWKETGTWQYVKESDEKSFSRLIYETLNN
ncbi:MAG: hypothetical protein MI867_25370 [Pseudomonadales bacterium]|nr:hypothetical protein [Pseudomonadales bacterium]